MAVVGLLVVLVLVKPIVAPPPASCEENFVYRDCGTCEGTCDNPRPNCDPKQCGPPGCYCPADQGFVRFGQQGQCVRVSQCRNLGCSPDYEQCGAYEEWNSCGTCDKYCESPGPNYFCPQRCMPKCECHKGEESSTTSTNTNLFSEWFETGTTIAFHLTFASPILTANI